jgi:hypothetical protein
MKALAPFCIVVLAVSLSGCFRAQARTTPDVPALDVPPAPPRNVEAADPTTPQPGALVEEPARNTPARPRPAPAQPRVEAAKPEPPKPDPAQPAAELAKPVEEPQRAQPTTTLQTAPAEREADFERGIRTLLTRATSTLNRIDYQRLNADARAQYDQAKRFVSQSEDALRTKNLLFAHNLADKAATLAAQLGGR